MTTLIATSVLRDSHRGERHEGVYLVDLDKRRVARVLERNTAGAGRPGAGWRGGLRGIAFDEDRLFLAARDELFAFTRDFEPLGTFRSPYLRQCEGMSVFRRRLFLVSAGYDSVLGFDLDGMRFSLGLHILAAENDFRATPFDPNGQKGPQLANRLGLNAVFCSEKGMFISGRETLGMLQYAGSRITRFATLPRGVHDARPWREGVLFNDGEAGVVRYVTPERNHVFDVPRDPEARQPGSDSNDRVIPEAAFPRGLCALDERRIASGSSPSTITLHDVEAMQTTLTLKLCEDPRSAIYSLDVRPYPGSG